jgi:hypothetical protein
MKQGTPFPADFDFSPVDNELPLRWLRQLHLVPSRGLGVVRRAVFLLALTWLPIFIWSVLMGRLVDTTTGEPLLRHYGVHARCLLAIPLFILAEAGLHSGVKRMASLFVSSGVVPSSQLAAFTQTLQAVRKLRDSSLPWVFVAGATLAWLVFDYPSPQDHVYSWAVERDGALGFGGWWYAYVARPIFVALLLGWFWRMGLVAYWFWRIGRLQLSLVPTHPDRTGGLAFVEKLPSAFALVTFGVTAVVGSRWAHDIAYHGETLRAYAIPAAVFVVVWTLFALAPLLALAPHLLAARKEALPAYASLVGEQGRLVHRRWILREKVEDNPLLDAPEIGPVADAAALYDAVGQMRVVPIGKVALLAVLGPIAVPLLAVAALQVPLRELLLTLLKSVL